MSGIEFVSGEKYPHGTRGRYVAGKCRCDDCRKANRDYAAKRAAEIAAGDTNGPVDASRARAHLETLAAQGLGSRAVADACDVARPVIAQVANGQRTSIRARTERRILSVDAGAVADGAAVDAKETHGHVRELIRLGLTKSEIASRLGSNRQTPALQIGKRFVRASTALRVKKLLEEVREEVAASRLVAEICTACGQSHSKERRLQWVRAHRDLDSDEMKDLQSCWYGGSAGDRQLHRDRAEVRGEAS